MEFQGLRDGGQKASGQKIDRLFGGLLATTAMVLVGGAVPISAALAQGSPLPGTGGYAGSAPIPGGGYIAPPNTQSTTGQTTPSPVKNKYQDLPLTAESAKYRLDELRALLSVSRPQDVQTSIQEMCEWLNDAADAHYRMYLSFAKSDLTKSQAASEKQLNLKFGQLKREAQLLRADLLIKQLRAPEALAPLVDIVAADPRSSTGQAAYKRLVELGFSQAVAAAPVVNPGSPGAASAASPEGPTKLPAMIPAVAPSELPPPAGAPKAKAAIVPAAQGSKNVQSGAVPAGVPKAPIAKPASKR